MGGGGGGGGSFFYMSGTYTSRLSSCGWHKKAAAREEAARKEAAKKEAARKETRRMRRKRGRWLECSLLLLGAAGTDPDQLIAGQPVS